MGFKKDKNPNICFCMKTSFQKDKLSFTQSLEPYVIMPHILANWIKLATS